MSPTAPEKEVLACWEWNDECLYNKLYEAVKIILCR